MQNTDTNEILLFQLILTEMMSDNLALLDLKNLKNIKLKKHCLNLKNQIKKEFNQNYYKKFDELANGSDLINYQKFYAQFIIEFVNSSTNERDSLIKSFLESRGHNVKVYKKWGIRKHRSSGRSRKSDGSWGLRYTATPHFLYTLLYAGAVLRH